MGYGSADGMGEGRWRGDGGLVQGWLGRTMKVREMGYACASGVHLGEMEGEMMMEGKWWSCAERRWRG